ncbi:hypothetical protein CCACVL1_04974 [Corchorus capsularis]|uniref:Uncharacterized protein n=1 Tax=Corchorus capsularis TaxID=210143 RepID=A0A1R3JNF9_COCAP|nr:hypothetical protein CCACVL1_04974 [Corchorus capsularis]
MDNLPPLHLLHRRAQKIIQLADSEMGLDYPTKHPGHAHAVRKNPALRELVRLLIAVEAEMLDFASWQVLSIWLDFDHDKIPPNQQATIGLQHRDMLEQLYSRGLTNFYNPPITLKNPLTRLEKMRLSKENPKIVLDGNADTLLLAITHPNLGFRISASFRFEPFTKSPVHSIELVFKESEENSDGGVSGSPIASPSDISAMIPLRLLVCNARGAGNTDFPEYIAHHYYNQRPHMTIFTETRLSGKNAKKIRNSLAFDRSVSLDASGFSGGLWLLWNQDDSDVNVLSKGSYEIRTNVQPLNLDPMNGWRDTSVH